MKKIIIIFFIFLVGLIFSQTDSVKNKIIFGCLVSEVNFIDYFIIKNKTSDKLAYYQGFDVSLFLRSKKKKHS